MRPAALSWLGVSLVVACAKSISPSSDDAGSEEAGTEDSGTDVLAPIDADAAVVVDADAAAVVDVASEDVGAIDVTSDVKSDAGSPFVPITITNNETTATGTSFQQMITFNPTQSSAYEAVEAPDLGNIRFYLGTSELKSWCESGCDNATSTSAVFWVNVPGGIGAGASIVVDMTFQSTSTEYDGVYAGEAPQLSATYAQYENGSSVFADYWSFATSTDLTGWNVARATATASDGLTLTCTSAGASYAPCGMAYSSHALSEPYIAETLAKPSTRIVGFGVITGDTPSATSNQLLGFVFGYVSYASSWYWNGNTGASSGGTLGSNWAVVQVEAQSSTDLSEAVIGTGSDAIATWNGAAGYLAFGGTSNGDSMQVDWARTRMYPPNGAMPTLAFGALSQ